MKAHLLFTIFLTVFIFPVFGQDEPRIKNSSFESVVRIQDKHFRKNGTGFIVSMINPEGKPDYYLITNKHMLGDWTPGEDFELDSFRQVYFYTYDSTHSYLPYPLYLITNGGTHSNLRLHPDPKVDIAAIYLKGVEKFIGDSTLKMTSFEFDDLVPIDQISSITGVHVGSNVYAIGYPAGKYAKNNGWGILKEGITSTPLNSRCTYDWRYYAKNGDLQIIESANKIFLVDCKFHFGNSGGAVIAVNSKNRNDLSTNAPKDASRFNNYLIGIVSSGNLDEGIAFVFSVDYILEMLEMFSNSK